MDQSIFPPSNAFGRPSRRNFLSRSGPDPSGLTLLEILVVVTILGVLAAFLYPAYASMQRRSEDVRCLQNLREIGVLAANYSAATDGRMLAALGPNAWYLELMQKGFLDPAILKRGGILRCPSNKAVTSVNNLANYAVNGFLGLQGGTYDIDTPRRGVIHRPSSILLAFDSPWRIPIRTWNTSLGVRPEIAGNLMRGSAHYSNPLTDGPPHGKARKGSGGSYVGGGLNAVFVDGSARYIALDDPNFSNPPTSSNANTTYWNTTGRSTSVGSNF